MTSFRSFSLGLLPVLLAAAVACGAERTAAQNARYRAEYATFLGGGAWDQAREVIVFPDGSVIVGAKLLFATYLGGSGDEMFRSIALGPKGEVYLVGSTSSEDFPVTPGGLQTTNKGKGDAFVVKLVPNGNP